jgi:hypothetical protein
MYRPATLPDGSNIEGRRTPGSALDHEHGEQAEPNEADEAKMGYRCRCCNPNQEICGIVWIGANLPVMFLPCRDAQGMSAG